MNGDGWCKTPYWTCPYIKCCDSQCDNPAYNGSETKKEEEE
jgi:hypothetical protein